VGGVTDPGPIINKNILRFLVTLVLFDNKWNKKMRLKITLFSNLENFYWNTCSQFLSFCYSALPILPFSLHNRNKTHFFLQADIRERPHLPHQLNLGQLGPGTFFRTVTGTYVFRYWFYFSGNFGSGSSYRSFSEPALIWNVF